MGISPCSFVCLKRKRRHRSFSSCIEDLGRRFLRVIFLAVAESNTGISTLLYSKGKRALLPPVFRTGFIFIYEKSPLAKRPKRIYDGSF